MKTALTLIAAAMFATSAFAADEDIKGLKIGLSKAEAQAVVGNPKTFSIAGITSVNHMMHEPGKKAKGTPMLEFKFDKLVQVNFWFRNDQYWILRKALMTKYPDMKCDFNIEETCRAGNIAIIQDKDYGEAALLVMMPVDDLVAADRREKAAVEAEKVAQEVRAAADL